MITTPFLVSLVGLILWLIFVKTKLSDPWMADLGRVCFCVGLFWTLYQHVGKVVF